MLTVELTATSDRKPILRPSRVPPVLSIGGKVYAVTDIRTRSIAGDILLHLKLTPISPLSALAAFLFG